MLIGSGCHTPKIVNGFGVMGDGEIEQEQKSVRSVKQNGKPKIDPNIYENLVHSRGSFSDDWGNHDYSVNCLIENINHCETARWCFRGLRGAPVLYVSVQKGFSKSQSDR